MKRLLIIALFGFTFSSIGQSIQTSFVYSVNPSNGIEKRPPLIIMLHGYRSNESDLFDISKSFDPRFLTISLRAPIAIEGGGFAWYHLDKKDGVHIYDYAEAKKSRDLILAFISKACKAYNADSTRVFIMGFSQGSIMAYDLALAGNGKIAGIIPLSGKMMAESKALKVDWIKLADLKLFIAHGSSDNVIPMDESKKAEAFFNEHHLKGITFKQYPIIHTISGDELNDLKRWLIKALEPKPTSSSK